MRRPTWEWLWRFLRVALLVGAPCLLVLFTPVPAPWAAGAAAGSAHATLLFLAAALVTVLGVFFLAVGRRKDDRWARQHPLLWWALLAIGSTVITTSLVGENLHASWRILDDHEYLTTLGPTGRITLGEVGRQIATSGEIAHPTVHSLRYRPVFHLMRLGQMLLFGDQPGGYWGVRVAQFWIAVCLAWWALWIWLGGLGAGLVLLWILSLTFWYDAWCRMGSAGESLGALGTAMLAAAVAGIVLELRRARTAPAPRPVRWGAYWGVLTVGAVLAIGSKETFLIVLPIVWAFAAWLRAHRKLGAAAWTSIAIVSLVGLWIGGVLFVAVHHSGTDSYLNPAGIGPRVRGLASWMTRDPGWYWTLAAALMALVTLVPLLLGWRHRGSGRGRRLWRTVGPLAILFLIFVATTTSQVILYNGGFPRTTRYDYPGLVAALLAIVVVADLALRGCAAFWHTHRSARGTGAVRALTLAALGLLVLGTGFDTLRQRSHLNVTESQNWVGSINKISDYVRQRPLRPIVLVAYGPGEWEPVISTMAFLRAHHVTNAVFLVNRFKLDNSTGPLERSLAEDMTRMATLGTHGFRPLDELAASEPPVAGIFFSGPPAWPTPLEVKFLVSSTPIPGEYAQGH